MSELPAKPVERIEPRSAATPRARLTPGGLALASFLLMQCLDGLFTYMGVQTFGIGIEANPILAALMTHLGHGPGVVAAKVLASGLGICLHLQEIHGAVALLTGFYLTAAVAPWTVILFF